MTETKKKIYANAYDKSRKLKVTPVKMPEHKNPDDKSVKMPEHKNPKDKSVKMPKHKRDKYITIPKDSSKIKKF